MVASGNGIPLRLNSRPPERRKVEMLFAHLKRHLNFCRLRLRGMTGARDECTLAAVAQNLRKLVKMIGFSPPLLRRPVLCQDKVVVET
jgi:hypothetical protein